MYIRFPKQLNNVRVYDCIQMYFIIPLMDFCRTLRLFQSVCQCQRCCDYKCLSVGGGGLHVAGMWGGVTGSEACIHSDGCFQVALQMGVPTLYECLFPKLLSTLYPVSF